MSHALWSVRQFRTFIVIDEFVALKNPRNPDEHWAAGVIIAGAQNSQPAPSVGGAVPVHRLDEGRIAQLADGAAEALAMFDA